MILLNASPAPPAAKDRGGRGRVGTDVSRFAQEFVVMAKKSTPSVAPKSAVAVKKAQPEVVSTTAVRNSPIPKAAPAKKVVSRDQIAVRAFEISCGPNCGSQDDNWF